MTHNACRRLFTAIVICLLFSCTQQLPPSRRPANWAKAIDAPGVPNLHQVSPSLYRGAQPDAAGCCLLHEMGIDVIVNARDEGSTPDPICANQRCITIPMSPWDAEDAHVIEFLRIATDPKQTPVFVHCQHGADRTGVLCAMYRIAVQGWTRDQAIDEMTRNDMGFHDIFQNLITYIRRADVDKIRSAAGIVAPPVR